MNTPENPPTEVEYASFNSRVFAWTIDIFVVMLVAVPATNWLLDNFFAPFGMAEIQKFINQPGIFASSDTLLNALWQMSKENHLIERTVLEYLIQGVFLGAYILPFWFYHSSTPGKMLMRMQIQDINTGLPLTRRQAAIRFFSYLVSLIPLTFGFIWVAFSKKKQGFHDIIAHTVVAVKPKTAAEKPRPLMK